MPRIRTIKPEFFSNEELSSCSPHSRLLAIALLQLADSEGRMRMIPSQILAHAFPWEALSLSPLLHELFTAEFIQIYKVESREYLQIINFIKHQRLSGKEAACKSKFPSLNQQDEAGEALSLSPLLHGEAPRCPGTREQGNKGTREQGTPLSESEKEKPQKKNNVPWKLFAEWYALHCPGLIQPRETSWTANRKKLISTQWHKNPDPEWWEGFIKYCGESKFLAGNNDRSWKADLFWLFNAENFAKINEGKYHRG